MTTVQDQGFAEWAILELMGHRRLAGRVTEATIAGASFLRLDVWAGCPECRSGGTDAAGAACVPCEGSGARVVATQYYSPAAVYAITPTTQAIAMDVAASNRPAPVQRWELPERVPVVEMADDPTDEPVAAEADGVAAEAEAPEREAALRIPCSRCAGYGFTAEPDHAPGCDGSCGSACPVPVQAGCGACGGTGVEAVIAEPPAEPRPQCELDTDCFMAPGHEGRCEKWQDLPF